MPFWNNDEEKIKSNQVSFFKNIYLYNLTCDSVPYFVPSLCANLYHKFHKNMHPVVIGYYSEEMRKKYQTQINLYIPINTTPLPTRPHWRKTTLTLEHADLALLDYSQ